MTEKELWVLMHPVDNKFNEMSYQYRHNSIPHELCVQIKQLMREKSRLKRSYIRNLKEINDYIKELAKELKNRED
jgi:hypothetical protein